MKRLLPAAPAWVLLLLAALLAGGETLPKGKYRKQAKPKTISAWKRHFRAKKGLVPGPPEPPHSDQEAVDFSGVYRFGRYDYTLVIRQKGDQVTFSSGGVDIQDIGGAFDTIGAGVVRKGRIHARWWCVDLSRNYANNGGAEMWFPKGDRDRIYVTYYHDADERIEDGYGVRLGTHEGEVLHYRIRQRHPVREFRKGLVLKGSVRGRGGEAVEDAVVMLRHEEQTAVRTDREGRWSITIRRLPTVLMLSAAAPGYRTRVEAILRHKVRDLHFVLEPEPFTDDPRYRFVDPTRNRGNEIWNCGNCHRNSYDEWTVSRHSFSAKSAVTRAVYEHDFLPALARGEASGDEGLCVACHAPGAATDGRVARLTGVEGVHLQGNHCDFCHKVHHTEDLEAAGVRGSLALGRPSPDNGRVPGPIKRIYGSLADSDYLFMGSVYNPYFATSALCAGCHQYVHEGLPAINTYAEWRKWASSLKEHKSCQACHMTTGTSMENKKLARRICVNALRRPEQQIHDHSFLGRELVADAVELRAGARVSGGQLRVSTSITTRDVGHKVPTGSAGKHLLLIVVATDAEGAPLALAEGPRVPAHAGGEGDPLALGARALDKRIEAGDLAGLPGREFAQVLVDKRGRTHVPFWRAVKVEKDTRLEPDRRVTVRHAFALKGRRPARVRVELYHRLRFKAHDAARGVVGPGVRPLDRLIVQKSVEVR